MLCGIQPKETMMFSGQLLNPNLALDFIKRERELDYRQANERVMARQARQARKHWLHGQEDGHFRRKAS